MTSAANRLAQADSYPEVRDEVLVGLARRIEGKDQSRLPELTAALLDVEAASPVIGSPE